MKFSINEGSHRSTYRFGFTFSDILHFKAIFGFNCVYDERQLEHDSEDINKLYGFSDGFNHMKNSARIGWNCKDGIIQIFAYAHVDGLIVTKYIGNALPGVEYEFKIYIIGELYIFDMIAGLRDSKSVQIRRPSYSKRNFKYFLYPYFGGQRTAPKYMEFTIKKKELLDF